MISQAPATHSLRSTAVSDLKFPPMPQTLTDIMRLRAEGAADVERLIEVVKNDPGIAASVLRRVNSAYYGLSRKVSQVDKAIGLLGYKEVYGLALAAVVRQAFAFQGTEEAGAIYRHIMRHSVATATIARKLAEQISPIATETAFTTGLLHQLGRLLLLSAVPRPYAELWLRLSPAKDTSTLVSPTPAMERFVFKTDYTQLGLVLAQHWGLPEEMMSVIRSHHDPDGIDAPFVRGLALMVAVGHAVSVELFEPASRTETIAGLLCDLAETRKMKPEKLHHLIDSHRDEARDFAESMMAE